MHRKYIISEYDMNSLYSAQVSSIGTRKMPTMLIVCSITHAKRDAKLRDVGLYAAGEIRLKKT